MFELKTAEQRQGRWFKIHVYVHLSVHREQFIFAWFDLKKTILNALVEKAIFRASTVT